MQREFLFFFFFFKDPLLAQQRMAFIDLKATSSMLIFVITNIFLFHTLDSKVLFYSEEKPEQLTGGNVNSDDYEWSGEAGKRKALHRTLKQVWNCDSDRAHQYATVGVRQFSKRSSTLMLLTMHPSIFFGEKKMRLQLFVRIREKRCTQSGVRLA